MIPIKDDRNYTDKPGCERLLPDSIATAKKCHAYIAPQMKKARVERTLSNHKA